MYPLYFTGERDGWGDLDNDQVLTTVSPFLTSLQVFASVGGLALLAEHLPLLYPEVSRQSVMQESGLDHMIKNMSLAAEEWSMIEPFPEDFYEVDWPFLFWFLKNMKICLMCILDYVTSSNTVLNPKQKFKIWSVLKWYLIIKINVHCMFSALWTIATTGI